MGLANGRLGVLLAASTLCAGCGASSRPLPAETVTENRLEHVGEIYRIFSMANQRPPRSEKELIGPRYSSLPGFEELYTGTIVMQWGASLPDLEEEPGKSRSDEVLGYYKTAPQEGGPVLMLDRTVRRMTAEEFKAAPKAGPK